ncbi:VOC family protein [Antrihabitans sp. YC2-6]|uniref:VOC family protein n=1 Tax=Antrihabitans sp. YC2-6 TaxID=2799498 RepID=UPI0018F6C807|nr:VOC family protein [Antrihabitans sp. YC2-6]MBJ8347918.1 VOC family protein [Antrihabitans sp. YC2-6]
MQVLSSRIILRPANYRATLSFYKDVLGLAISREYASGTVFFAGQGLIEVADHGGSGSSNTFEGALWLQVKDIAKAQSELAAKGVRIDREAKRESWGLHELWITDPDGVKIVVVQVPDDHPLRRDSRS